MNPVPDPFNDAEARAAWSKYAHVTSQETEAIRLPFNDFNQSIGGVFQSGATLSLDHSDRRQTVIMAVPDTPKWNADIEALYAIVRDGRIMKLGGTRTGMKKRFSSYLCGHCVPQRLSAAGQPFPGKMSVTNAHLYHTIEDGLLRGEDWKIYMWELPNVQITVDILGTPTVITAQTYHAYESRAMQRFVETAGAIPLLCNNADPNYR